VIRVVRLGSPRRAGEGLRLGTVRRPPRGVPKARHAADGWYDVWLPTLAPSAALLATLREGPVDARRWAAFARRYRAEMRAPPARDALALLAALSHGTDVAVGCYCADPARCHRTVLAQLLAEAVERCRAGRGAPPQEAACSVGCVESGAVAESAGRAGARRIGPARHSAIFASHCGRTVARWRSFTWP
jgi:uncharacterized protein YeaO (DUF488 family)